MGHSFNRFGHRIYLLCAAGATVLALVLRTLALFFELDSIGYLNGTLSTLTTVVQVIALIGCIVYSFLIKKDTLPASAAPIGMGRIFCALSALVLAVAAVLLIANLSAIEQKLLVIPAVLALFCGVAYFLLRFLRYEGAYALFGFGIILGAVLLISLTYFDLFTPMNAPRKTSLHLCLLATMLYLLYELRAAVSIPMPRVQLAACSICFLLVLSNSGSNLIYALTHETAAIYPAGDLVTLAVALFAAVRLVEPLLSPAQNTNGEETVV